MADDTDSHLIYAIALPVIVISVYPVQYFRHHDGTGPFSHPATAIAIYGERIGN